MPPEPSSTAPVRGAAALLEVADLRVALHSARGPVRPVDGVGFTVAAGETFALLGESGCGKSMTALALTRLLPDAGRIAGGSVRLGGDDLLRLPETGMRAVRGGRIGMIFQHFNLLHNRTVAENVAFPLRIAQASPERIRSRVADCLAYVGLSDKANAYPAQLSGGQKQRVAIARALAPEPHLLLADEPTSALDPRTTLALLDVLADINRRFGVSILLVSHEMSVIRRLCHRVSVMEAGHVIERVSLTNGQVPAGSRLAQWLAEFGGGDGGASPAPDAYNDAREREASHV